MVIGSRSCPACAEAERYLREQGLEWPVRTPCETDSVDPCWVQGAEAWSLPTLLRREGDSYRVLVRGFSESEWKAYR